MLLILQHLPQSWSRAFLFFILSLSAPPFLVFWPDRPFRRGDSYKLLSLEKQVPLRQETTWREWESCLIGDSERCVNSFPLAILLLVKLSVHGRPKWPSGLRTWVLPTACSPEAGAEAAKAAEAEAAAQFHYNLSLIGINDGNLWQCTHINPLESVHFAINIMKHTYLPPSHTHTHTHTDPSNQWKMQPD